MIFLFIRFVWEALTNIERVVCARLDMQRKGEKQPERRNVSPEFQTKFSEVQCITSVTFISVVEGYSHHNRESWASIPVGVSIQRYSFIICLREQYGGYIFLTGLSGWLSET